MTLKTMIDLASPLVNTQGFTILGSAAGDYSGSHVSTAGDVNNDGYADIIISAYDLYPQAQDPSSAIYTGKFYVIYGNTTNPELINLALPLIDTQGFVIERGFVDYPIFSHVTVQTSGRGSGAGDVNGDGFDDIIIGASSSKNYAGISYVVYGGSNNPGIIDLSNDLTSDQGFIILGGAAGDRSGGSSVSAAGDVNGDGFDDVIIGAHGAVPSSKNNAGISYIIYGGSDNPGTIDLSDPLGSKGFYVLGGAAGDQSGLSVSDAGDVNGDGYDDVVIGAASAASVAGRSYAGISYIIYGGSDNPGTIDLSDPLGSKGFYVLGGAAGDQSGLSVSDAGDVNGDGYDDVVIGAASAASVAGRSYAGISYIIYGGSDNPGTIDLANSLGSKGFYVLGGAANDYSGRSVSAAGDVNNDGFDDVIIGAFGADPNSKNDAGISYVIYGDGAEPTSQPTSQPFSELSTIPITPQIFANYNYPIINQCNDKKYPAHPSVNYKKNYTKTNLNRYKNKNNIQKDDSLKKNIVTKHPIGVELTNKTLELIDYQCSDVKFDYYDNNNPLKSSWVGANDAILFYDHNHNMKVDIAKEIVLTDWCLTRANTDFEALLCNFDSSGDKIFNKQDQDFVSFYLWQDKNQDGISQDGEIISLIEAGIFAIDFNTQEEVRGELKDLGALNKAEVLWGDGTITFAYDLVFTHDTSLIALLPESTGYDI